MNALKNILFFGLLIAVLCGVYLSLNRPPEQPLPQELLKQATPPNIGGVPDISGPPGLNVANAPASSGAAAVAPPQAPTKEWPNSRGDTAPPFAAQQNPVMPSPSTANLAPPFQQRDAAGEKLAALQPPPGTGRLGDTPAGHDPFHNPSYPAGVANPYPSYPGGVSNPSSGSAAAGSASAGGLATTGGSSGNLSVAPSWSSQPSRPETTNVSNRVLPPEEAARTTSIDAILQQVGLKANEGKFADALLILSPLYDNPDVPEEKAKKITEVLDYMAAKVIYSREEMPDAPRYGVRPGDTLESIAEHYKVTPLLLARINGISDPQNLSPGKELKVLNGPFVAKVSTARNEMTMMLNGRYAGRFPIKLSGDLQQVTGFYHVRAKSPPAAGGTATKQQWIELQDNATGKIGIEAASELRSQNPRTLSLSEQDMDDVYGILSVGSVLIIQR